MSIVFNISREGQNADTLNPNNLVVTSNATQFKILKTGIKTVSISDGSFSNSGKIDHGMDYRPAYLSYVEYPDDPGRFWMIRTDMGTNGISSYGSESNCNSYSLKFEVDRFNIGSSGNVSANFSYLIFDQPAYAGAKGDGIPMGYKSSDQGIIVSKEGFDADNSSLYNQQINSNADYLKYHYTRDLTTTFNTVSNGSKTIDVTHNLGYIPVFSVYGKPSTEQYYTMLPFGQSSNPFISSSGANKTNITTNLVWAGTGSGTLSFDYRIIIFKNRMIVS